MKILDENSLIDIGYIGLLYAWWNNRTHKDVAFERLDRVVVNPQWLNIYKDARVKNLR